MRKIYIYTKFRLKSYFEVAAAMWDPRLLL
jgi:hypothetical protein